MTNAELIRRLKERDPSAPANLHVHIIEGENGWEDIDIYVDPADVPKGFGTTILVVAS